MKSQKGVREETSQHPNILMLAINALTVVGSIPFAVITTVVKIILYPFRLVSRVGEKAYQLLIKCTRFGVVTIPNACKNMIRGVFSKLRISASNIVKAFRVLINSAGVACKKVVHMPNKYALKSKQLIKESQKSVQSSHVRKNYREVALAVAPVHKSTSFFTKVKIFVGGSLFSLVFLVAPALGYSWYRALPRPELLAENAQTHRPTRILDRNGVPLYEIYVDKKYAPIALSKIPKSVILATLAVEDHEFFNHNGVRPLSLIRAAKATIMDDALQGGSTITQQLIKNVLLSPERTMTRKLKELFLAFAVERKYTKDEILEMYLNNIPYGGTAWGIQSASQKFFGKNVDALTLGEAAFLAGLPSSPSSYVSYANDIDMARARQKLVLNRMEELGIITSAQNTKALGEELKFVEQAEYIKAPHFVHYVRKELERRYGRQMVESGGLTVKTSLDLDLHTKLQAIVADEVAKAGNLNISNGALVVLEPKTGQILAYVGSVDYFKEGWGAYDVITALRQPGSSIKPVTYALALERGYTAASAIVDGPLTIQLGGGQTYKPVNYDGKFHGTVTLRSALANSYNIPAVKLVKEVGPDNMVTLGNKMGLKNWQVDDSYGYSVTLGGKETRLLDLTNVFATFARGGVYRPTTPFISIKDANGFDIYSADEVKPEEVLSPESAYIISNILSDNNARTPAFGSQSQLVIPGHTVAVKTGTTNEKRDNLTIGYTPSFVVGVWVGNNDNKPMNQYLASGVSGAAPIWNLAMRTVLEGTKNEEFIAPEGVFVKYDNKCGRSEVFTQGSKVPNLCPEKPKDKDKDNDKKDKRD